VLGKAASDVRKTVAVDTGKIAIERLMQPKANNKIENYTCPSIYRCYCYLLLLSAVTHAPFHAPVLRPTSWPNARDRRDGKVN